LTGSLTAEQSARTRPIGQSAAVPRRRKRGSVVEARVDPASLPDVLTELAVSDARKAGPGWIGDGARQHWRSYASSWSSWAGRSRTGSSRLRWTSDLRATIGLELATPTGTGLEARRSCPSLRTRECSGPRSALSVPGLRCPFDPFHRARRSSWSVRPQEPGKSTWTSASTTSAPQRTRLLTTSRPSCLDEATPRQKTWHLAPVPPRAALETLIFREVRALARCVLFRLEQGSGWARDHGFEWWHQRR